MRSAREITESHKKKIIEQLKKKKGLPQTEFQALEVSARVARLASERSPPRAVLDSQQIDLQNQFEPIEAKRPKLSKQQQASLVARLARDRSKIYQMRQQLRQELAEFQLRECTFTPLGRFVEADTKQVSQKLFKEAEYKSRRIEQLQKQKAKEQLFDVTFKPQINPSEVAHRPIRQRVQDLVKQKQQAILLRQWQDQNKYTFKPEISVSSEILLRLRRGQEDVISRLTKSKYRETQEEPQERVVKASSNSLKLLQSNPLFKPEIDFANRQRIYQQTKQLGQEEQQDQNCTFQPQINDYPSPIPRPRKKILRPDDQEAGLFQPQINRLSSRMAKTKSVQELHQNPRGRELKLRLLEEKKLAEEEEQRLFTKKKSGKWDGHLYQGFFQREEKKLKLQFQRKVALQQQAEQECRFAPSRVAVKEVRQKPAREVAGMEQFRSRTEKIRSQKEERRRVEVAKFGKYFR